MVLDLIAECVGIIHEGGGCGPRGRAQGRPQQHLVRMGGDASLHVHTMYFDPTNDYGRSLTGK